MVLDQISHFFLNLLDSLVSAGVFLGWLKISGLCVLQEFQLLLKLSNVLGHNVYGSFIFSYLFLLGPNLLLERVDLGVELFDVFKELLSVKDERNLFEVLVGVIGL